MLGKEIANREPAKSRGLLTTPRWARVRTRETNNWCGWTSEITVVFGTLAGHRINFMPMRLCLVEYSIRKTGFSVEHSPVLSENPLDDDDQRLPIVYDGGLPVAE